MRLGIKAKQVLGVTTIVGAAVVLLSAIHVARLAQVSLDEAAGQAGLLAKSIYQRAQVVVRDGSEPYEALVSDSGLRTILEASLYSQYVTFAAIVNPDGIAVAHVDPSLEGRPLRPGADLEFLLTRSQLAQLQVIFSDRGRNLEYRQPLLLGDQQLGSIRLGVSTLLVRDDLTKALRPALMTAAVALTIAVFGAMLLAQLVLRPIHVIRSGLTRLGQGEFGVKLDLDRGDEFGELGMFFNAVSAQLSADRSQMAGQVANLESAVQLLEDAVGIVDPRGTMLFANPAFQALLPGAKGGAVLSTLLPREHALVRIADDALATRQPKGPLSATFSVLSGGQTELSERMVLAQPVTDERGGLVGIMLTVRNLEYLARVESTVRYSRKLAALGRLSAGVAHEVKNPLNAMMIHLELLRQKFSPRPVAVAAGRGGAVPEEPPPIDVADAMQHLNVISGEIRRLDEVVQGFLKFTRPEDLKLQPVALAALFAEVLPIVRPTAEEYGVQVVVDCDGGIEVNGDAGMLRQAFLNLALNACQAMPKGGLLRIASQIMRGRRVLVTVADTGVGIKPEHLKRIFDLYFTTKESGSGIGLSMVYRTVQMHDGEIEVESTPGKGTTFRVLLPQA